MKTETNFENYGFVYINCRLFRNLRILKTMLNNDIIIILQHEIKGDVKLMLETSEERVRLLKNGVERKKIEELYIQYNRLKIIHNPILFEFNENSLKSRINSQDTPVIELQRTFQGTDGDENSTSLLADA